uniref:Uncharacterized protein n=1 Tax=Parascaris equorum TaxID=6256 RepID=A0A914R967_PAREQ
MLRLQWNATSQVRNFWCFEESSIVIEMYVCDCIGIPAAVLNFCSSFGDSIEASERGRLCSDKACTHFTIVGLHSPHISLKCIQKHMLAIA